MAALDPITLGVYWNKLVSIAEEAASALARTAFSRVVTDTRDYSSVLCDAEGELIAQSLQSMPGFVGTLNLAVRQFLRVQPPETLEPGDSLMSNDPWINTSQMNDFALVTPIFVEGRIVAYAASVSHSPDVGGRLVSAEAREVYEEGMCFPVCKLWERGQPNDLLFRIIRTNVRIPDVVVGDINALHAANLVMEQLLLQFLAAEGLPDIDDLAREIKDRSERAMRQAIASIPPGSYESAVTMDGLEHPATIRCRVDVLGDSIAVDYAGSSPANPGSQNCALNYCSAESMFTLVTVCQPGTHVNAGTLRPLSVVAPEGCLLNVQRPTAVGARTLVVQFCASTIYQALSRTVPDRVLAETSAPTWPIMVSGKNQLGRRFVEMIFLNGGLGARPHSDGLVLGFPSPVVSTKVEVFESEHPLVVERSELIADSGGAGRFRGGPGQSFHLRCTAKEPVMVLLRTERLRHAAGGVVGGMPGRTGMVRWNGKVLMGKEIFMLQPGDLLELESPGGGGHGPLAERDPGLMARDVEDGMVSPRAASGAYRWNPHEGGPGGVLPTTPRIPS